MPYQRDEPPRQSPALSSGLLLRGSLVLVDDGQPGEDEILMLYSLYCREDRQTGQIAVHISRVFAFKDGWIGDAMLYRI